MAIINATVSTGGGGEHEEAAYTDPTEVVNWLQQPENWAYAEQVAITGTTRILLESYRLIIAYDVEEEDAGTIHDAMEGALTSNEGNWETHNTYDENDPATFWVAPSSTPDDDALTTAYLAIDEDDLDPDSPDLEETAAALKAVIRRQNALVAASEPPPGP